MTTPSSTPSLLVVPSAAVDRVVAVRRSTGRRVLRARLVLGVVLLGLVAARVLLGDYTVTIPDLVRILSGETIPGASFIVMESKLPRAVLAVLAGSALGVSGAVFQGMLRNPLASPDILGLTTGASAGAVVAITVLGLRGAPVTVAALIGALLVAGTLMALGAGRVASDQTIIVAGVGLAAVLAAVIHALLLRTHVRVAQDALVWLTGSLATATWADIGRLAVVVAVLLPTTFVLHRDLRLVGLGDDLAAGLGVPVARRRGVALLCVVGLVAAAASVCGPVLFVALLSGPAARRLLGGREDLPTAALVGACLVVAADYVAAYAFAGVNLPVGVVTGLAGAPFLLWLVLGRSRPSTEGAVA